MSLRHSQSLPEDGDERKGLMHSTSVEDMSSSMGRPVNKNLTRARQNSKRDFRQRLSLALRQVDVDAVQRQVSSFEDDSAAGGADNNAPGSKLKSSIVDVMNRNKSKKKIMANVARALASYVPNLVLDQFALYPSALTSPLAMDFDGVILFADIAGFTPLTEKLTQQGDQGVEVLTLLLNDFFGRLIDIIKAFNGDVVKFAGDALFICWPCGMEVTREVLMAIQCGLAVQSELRDYTTVTGDKLKLRISLGVGQITGLHVGGVPHLNVPRWEYLIVGDPLVQVSDGSPLAGHGEVVVSQAVYDLVDHLVVAKVVGDDDDDGQTGGESPASHASTPKMGGGAHTGTGDAGAGTDGNGDQDTMPSPSLLGQSMLSLLNPRLLRGSGDAGDDEDPLANALGEDGDHDTQEEQETTQSKFYRIVRILNPLTVMEEEEIEVSKEMADACRSYIPASVRTKLDAGQLDWTNELRLITVVFVNLMDLTADDPENLNVDVVNTVFTSLQKDIYAQDGIVRQFLMDDKGSVLIAAFGLPPRSHADDPSRGVKAALAMHASLEALEMRSSIGVTTGKVFCGAVGSSRRREYAMVGDIVNLSARLMSAAKKEQGILVDRATYSEARSDVVFDTLEPIKVKGKANKVDIFRPVQLLEAGTGTQGRPDDDEDESVLIAKLDIHPEEKRKICAGIDAFTQRILGGAGSSGMTSSSSSSSTSSTSSQDSGGMEDDETEDRESVVYLIGGEAGMGQSSLAAQVAGNYEGHKDVRVVTTSAQDREQTSPYYAWAQLVPRLLGLQAGEGHADMQTQIAEQLRASGARNDVELLPLLNSVMPYKWPETEAVREMGSQKRAQQLKSLLLQLVELGASRSTVLVLVFEAVQWMDNASFALLSAVVDGGVPNAVLILTQEEEKDSGVNNAGRLAEVASAPWCTSFVLTPLQPQRIDTLVAQVFGVDTIPREVSEVVNRKGQGNPFFSIQVALTLKEANAVQIRNGFCTVVGDNMDAVELPTSLVGIVTSRIDSLSPQQQLLLKVASVIGPVFSVHLLVHVHPIQTMAESLVTDLALLSKYDLVEKLPSTDIDVLYKFKHSYTLDAAYSMMLYSHRRRLHRKVAEYYEEYHSDALERHCTLLSYHYGKAHHFPKTVEYLQLSADQALRRFANQEAIGAYQSLLDLYDRMLSHGEEMLEELNASNSESAEESDLQRMLVDGDEGTLNKIAGLQQRKQGRRSTSDDSEEETDDDEAEGDLTSRRISIFQSNRRSVMPAGRGGAVSLDDDEEDEHGEEGSGGVSSSSSSSSSAAAEEANQPTTILDVINVDGFLLSGWKRKLGTAYFNVGDTVQAQKLLLSALEDMEANVPTTEFKLNNGVKLEKGRLAMRKHSYADTAASKRSEAKLERYTNLVLALIYLARCSLLNGQTSLSSWCTWKAVSAAEKLSHSGALVEAYALGISNLCMSSGNNRKAIANLLAKGEHSIERMNRLQSTAHFLLVKGTYQVSQGELEDARVSLRQSLDAATQVGDDRLREECLIVSGFRAFFANRMQHAGAYVKQAITSARTRGDFQSQAMGQNMRMLVMAAQDKVNLCLDAVLQVDRLYEDHTEFIDVQSLVNAYAIKAWVQLKVNEGDLALDSARKALDMMGEGENAPAPTLALFQAHFCLCEVLFTLWNDSELLESTGGRMGGSDGPKLAKTNASTKELAKMAGEALERLTAFAEIHPCCTPRRYTMSAWQMFMLGKDSKSLNKGVKAEASAKEMGMTFEQIVYHELAARWMGEGPGKQHLKKVRELKGE